MQESYLCNHIGAEYMIFNFQNFSDQLVDLFVTSNLAQRFRLTGLFVIFMSSHSQNDRLSGYVVKIDSCPNGTVGHCEKTICRQNKFILFNITSHFCLNKTMI